MCSFLWVVSTPTQAALIIISNSGKITAARSYTEGIRRGDVQLLRIVAGMKGLPGDGWGVKYLAVPEAVVMSGTLEAETPDAGDPPEPPIEQDAAEDAAEEESA